ncbi:MAG: transcription antitermination factor NusB [Alphaproteobacteria bacterium]
MSETRKIAIKALQDIIENKIFLSEIKEEFGEEKALLNMLLLTSLRHYVFFKKTLKNYVKKKIPEKSAIAEYALILAMTEILYLKTPEYATINSYVEIVKKQTDKFLGGFINAVLRKICADKEEILSLYKGEFFSRDFIDILKQDYSREEISKIEKASTSETLLDLTAKGDPKVLAEKLGGTLLPNGTIRLASKGNISQLDGYEAGEWWVQDVAASLAALTIGNIEGKRVLDLCSAPGGKAAQLINKGGKITCLDVADNRIGVLEENLTRLQMEANEIICTDGIKFLAKYEGEKFDAILLDAPCSATGIIRRHPETALIKDINDLKAQEKLQRAFLRHISKALKKDGILVYCTCSISKFEGEKQINSFLKENKNFKIVPIKEKEINIYDNEGKLKNLITKERFIRTLPYHLEELGGMDSFFIAKLQKVD